MSAHKTKDRQPSLAAYVAKVIKDAPPLSPSQLDKVANLLRGGSK